MQERVHSAIVSILKRHGAVRVTPPLLAPRRASRPDDEQEEGDGGQDATQPESELTPAATFMDMSGTVVTLPYDLRVPFARFISRNVIHNLKRYAIEKVFRKVKIHRSHPKELWECAFDIVTPTVCNLIPDAEAMSFVSEVISAFPVLFQRSYTIIVNHTVLLYAIFDHSGIRPDKHEDVKRTLTEAKAEKANKLQLQTRLGDLSLTSQQVSTLCSFIDQQGPLSKIQSLLKPLTRNKQSAVSSQARQGLHELEALRKNLDAFGVKLPVIVHLGFVHNLHQYSGIVFQVSAEVKKQKKTMNEVLAAGGRYDDLVQRMALPQLGHTGVFKNHDNEIGVPSARKHCAFGVSIAVERIVSLSLAEYHSASKNSASSTPSESNSSPCPLDQSPLSTVDVLVAAMGRSQLFQERIRILRDLWDAGIHAEMTLEGEGCDADSLEVLQELAMKRGITHLVLLKDKDNSVKVRSHNDSQGFSKQQEKSLNAEDLVDYLLKKIKGGDDTSVQAPRHNTDYSSSSNLVSVDAAQPSAGASTHHGTRRLNVDIVPQDKLTHHIKKRYEAQVHSHLSSLPILQHLNVKTEVCVLAADLPGSAIKTLAQELELNQGEEEFNKSVANSIAKMPKYKKYMEKITDLISDAKFHKDLPLIIIYSYKDDVYRLLS